MDVHGLRTLTFSIEISQTTHFGINTQKYHTQKYHTQKYQTKTNFGSKQSSILTVETVTRVTRCFFKSPSSSFSSSFTTFSLRCRVISEGTTQQAHLQTANCFLAMMKLSRA